MKRVVVSIILVALVLSSIPITVRVGSVESYKILNASRAGWTRNITFENGTPGEQAVGDTGFDSAGSNTTFSNDIANTGNKSAKFFWHTGEDGFAQDRGEVHFPELLSEGDEIWVRGYFYFKSPWSWNCSPRVKILRIHVRADNGSHIGYLSVLASNGGVITLSNEVDTYEPQLNYKFDVDRWQSIEMYVKFSTTDPIFRIWKDGVLIAEDRGHLTLHNSSDVADFALVMSYWNGGAPQDQVEYVDDFVYTSITPSNHDAHGNPMIGPIGWRDGNPTITQAPATAGDRERIEIRGTNFGFKEHAAPFRTSYYNPNSSMNFQQTGSFDSTYWWLTGDVMINLQNNFGRVPGRYYVRLAYNKTANYNGYSASVRTDLPFNETLREHYIAWWDYLSTNFNFSNMHTGAVSIKYIYIAPGAHPHATICITQDEKVFADAKGGVGGNTSDEQMANLTLPYGGGFYGRPISWETNYMFPKGQWYFMELFYKVNSAPGVHDGWVELHVNNQLIYRADHIDIYDPNETNEPSYPYIAFGGNYGWVNESINDTYYRYYGDIYIDDTFARVYIGDKQNFSNCEHLELQVPTSWSDGAINITFNPGTFANGSTVYLFVVDENGNVSNGYPIRISSTPVPEFAIIIPTMTVMLAVPVVLLKKNRKNKKP